MRDTLEEFGKDVAGRVVRRGCRAQVDYQVLPFFVGSIDIFPSDMVQERLIFRG